MHPAMPVELWSIPFSPFSLRAKWALRHCKVDYKSVTYQLPVSEWLLRWKLQQWRVSVPVLFDGDIVLTQSFAIAKYADAKRPETQKSIICDGMEPWLDMFESLLAQERCAQCRGMPRYANQMRSASRYCPSSGSRMVAVILSVSQCMVRVTWAACGLRLALMRSQQVQRASLAHVPHAPRRHISDDCDGGMLPQRLLS